MGKKLDTLPPARRHGKRVGRERTSARYPGAQARGTRSNGWFARFVPFADERSPRAFHPPDLVPRSQPPPSFPKLAQRFGNAARFRNSVSPRRLRILSNVVS